MTRGPRARLSRTACVTGRPPRQLYAPSGSASKVNVTTILSLSSTTFGSRTGPVTPPEQASRVTSAVNCLPIAVGGSDGSSSQTAVVPYELSLVPPPLHAVSKTSGSTANHRPAMLMGRSMTPNGSQRSRLLRWEQTRSLGSAPPRGVPATGAGGPERWDLESCQRALPLHSAGWTNEHEGDGQSHPPRASSKTWTWRCSTQPMRTSGAC